MGWNSLLKAKMPNELPRQVKIFASLVAVSSALALLILLGSMLFPRSNVENIKKIEFPTRELCTPVSDPLHPPLYPDAQQISVISAATHQWLAVMYTTTFQTADNPETVLAFYQDEMSKQGWTQMFQLSNDLKMPGGSKYDHLEPEVANMPDIVDVLGFAAFCGTSSAHPISVNVVIRSPRNGSTEVDLRVY